MSTAFRVVLLEMQRKATERSGYFAEEMRIILDGIAKQEIIFFTLLKQNHNLIYYLQPAKFLKVLIKNLGTII